MSLSLSFPPPRGSGGRCGRGEEGAGRGGVRRSSAAELLVGARGRGPVPSGAVRRIGFSEDQGRIALRGGDAPDLLRRRGELLEDMGLTRAVFFSLAC